MWSWFTVNGLSQNNALTATSVIILQVVIGFPLAVTFFRLNFTLIGLIGVSFAVGAIEVTIADQLANGLGIPLVLLLVVPFSPLLVKSTRENLVRLPNSSALDFQILLILPVIVMAGVGNFDRTWMSSLLILVATLTCTYIRSIRTSRLYVFLLSFSGYLIWTSFLMSSQSQTQSYGDFVLRPLYTGSDDQIFSESLGWSLSHFGPGEYAAASGTSIRYHWFALAWSGFIEKISSVEPLITTLHVIPAVAFVVTALITFEAVRIVTNSTRAGYFTLLVLFGTATLFSPDRFFHVVNTSNIAPFMWLGLIFLSFVAYSQDSLRYPTVFIPVLLCIVLLSKAPYGLSAGFGVVATLLWMIRERKRKQIVAQIALSIIGAVTTYLLFLSPHHWEQRKFTIDWNLGGIGIGSSLYPLVPLIAIAVLVSTSSVGYLPLLGKRLDEVHKVALCFLISASTVGFLRFVLSGGSAELYFFNVLIYLSSIAAGLGAESFLENSRKLAFTPMLVIASASFLMMTIELRNGFLENVLSHESSNLAAPLVIGLILSVFFLSFQKRKPPRFGLSWSSALVIATVFALIAILSNKVQQPADFSASSAIASTEELEALSWLRTNSPEDSLIATNRTLCRSETTCDKDESHYLISAVAKRRVFLEGPRFVVGGRPYPGWVNERIETSLDFSELPNTDSAVRLRKSGVTWFYFLKSQSRSDRTAFVDVGSVEFENSAVLIIKLRVN